MDLRANVHHRCRSRFREHLFTHFLSSNRCWPDIFLATALSLSLLPQPSDSVFIHSDCVKCPMSPIMSPLKVCSTRTMITFLEKSSTLRLEIRERHCADASVSVAWIVSARNTLSVLWPISRYRSVEKRHSDHAFLSPIMVISVLQFYIFGENVQRRSTVVCP